jgi:hypothetical protein
MLACRNSVIARPLVLLGAQDGFGQFLFRGLLLLLLGRVLDQAHQEGDALDQFGDALQRQQTEAHGHQGIDRPADQAAGVAGGLARLIGLRHQRQDQVDHHQAEGQEEDDDADGLDGDLGALGEAAEHHVDLHVFLAQQRVARGQQEDAGKQVPLDFQEGIGADVEGLAGNGVEGTDEHRGQDQPGGAATDPLIESVDPS